MTALAFSCRSDLTQQLACLFRTVLAPITLTNTPFRFLGKSPTLAPARLPLLLTPSGHVHNSPAALTTICVVHQSSSLPIVCNPEAFSSFPFDAARNHLNRFNSWFQALT